MQAWIPGVVVNATSTHVEVETSWNGVRRVHTTPQALAAPRDRLEAIKVVLPRWSVSDDEWAEAEDVANLDGLRHKHQAAVLSTVRQRFRRGETFTYAGDVLVSVNPCEATPLATSTEAAARYLRKSDDELSTLPPHAFHVAVSACACLLSRAPVIAALMFTKVAPTTMHHVSMRDVHLSCDTVHVRVQERAVRCVANTSSSASIMSVGESGSGKTEAVRSMLRYFQRRWDSDIQQRLMTRVLAGQQLLDAFVTAKTRLHHNSR